MRRKTAWYSRLLRTVTTAIRQRGGRKVAPASQRPGQLLVRVWWLCAALLLGACAGKAAPSIPRQVEKIFPSIAQTVTETPFQPVPSTPTPSLTPTVTPVPFRGLEAWIDPSLPEALAKGLRLPKDTRLAKTPGSANLQIGAIRGGLEQQVTWVYALAAPYPTVRDDVSLEEIERAWRGKPGQDFEGSLLVSPSTQAAYQMHWGPPGGQRLKVLPEDQLLETAWENRLDWAIIPFEQIEPRWKILRIDGLSLFDKELDLKAYPLTIWFGLSGEQQALGVLKEALAKQGSDQGLFPPTNYDPKKLTVLAMTGVTALARATAFKMDTSGSIYPARDIQDWLRNADITHISNEVSFNPDCPPGNPNTLSTMFCSRPEYIKLLDFIGTDIVELSGNHNNDYGRKAFTFSLDLYAQRGWSVFAGGANLEEARRPAKIERDGLRLAFLGCNPVGPPGVWATQDEPGAANCDDYQWLLDSIRSLRAEGYLPIVTFQYFEIYVPFPSDHQQRHFREAIDAGAIIVSGSQAHFPQQMEFYNNGFIHYGLGNLFFDQMDIPVKGTRREFVDRHIFYDGRYINTELLTALLEDYARPRPMTTEERRAFLEEIFEAAGW